MAQTVLRIAKNQNDERMQAISLIAIGEITKSLQTLHEALQIYEESQEQVLTNQQYALLCLNLAREYRKMKDEQGSAMAFLEQAFNINQKSNE